LHYYDREGGDRLGVIERSRIESCVLLENGKTFDLLCNNGVVFEFTVADSTQASKWVDLLKPKKVTADKEGWLFKKKEKKSLTGISRAKKRWCVLSADSFKYFDSREGGRCLGALPLGELVASLHGEGEMRLVHGKESYAFASCPDGGPSPAEWVAAVTRLAKLQAQQPASAGNAVNSGAKRLSQGLKKQHSTSANSLPRAAAKKEEPNKTVAAKDDEEEPLDEAIGEPPRSPRGKVSVPRVSGAKRRSDAEAAAASRRKELEAAEEEPSSDEPIPIDYGQDVEDEEPPAAAPPPRAVPASRGSGGTGGRGRGVTTSPRKELPVSPHGRGTAARTFRAPEKKLPEDMYVANDHLLDEDSSDE
jgi:hypothetical protein